ncbi:MAG: hypothetical protein M5R38_13920 [Candidatus Methylomirabilis sp.]|nr:hypothetical protein [Candidatus Methylomirabilis sp.]
MAALEEGLADGGMGLALVNTVQRAQDLYQLFPEGERLEREGQCIGKRLSDGTEVLLFHARFPADRRQRHEDQALETFGESTNRTGRKILIATQVAEQSLDLDFDLIATDLAPIDLVLQRAGALVAACEIIQTRFRTEATGCGIGWRRTTLVRKTSLVGIGVP